MVELSLHPKDGDVGVFSTCSRGNRRGAWQRFKITRQSHSKAIQASKHWHGPSGLKSSCFVILTSTQSWISHGHHALPATPKTWPNPNIASSNKMRSRQIHLATTSYHKLPQVVELSLHPKDGDVGVFSTCSRGNRRGAWQRFKITRQSHSKAIQASKHWHGPSGLKSSCFVILTSTQSWISHGHHALPATPKTWPNPNIAPSNKVRSRQIHLATTSYHKLPQATTSGWAQPSSERWWCWCILHMQPWQSAWCMTTF